MTRLTRSGAILAVVVAVAGCGGSGGHSSSAPAASTPAARSTASSSTATTTPARTTVAKQRHHSRPRLRTVHPRGARAPRNDPTKYQGGSGKI
jgi:hypothetical protein